MITIHILHAKIQTKKEKEFTMNFDIEKSLTYLFKETNWKKKALIGSLLMLGLTILNILSTLANYIEKLKPEQLEQYSGIIIPVLIATILIGLVCAVSTMFAEGYFLKTFNQKIFKPNEETPAWTNWKELFAIGLKSGLAGFIYMALFGLSSIIALLILYHAGFKGNVINVFATLIFLAWEIINIIIIGTILVGGRIAFATNLKFSAYFDYETIRKIVFDNFLKFIIYVLLVVTIGAGITIASSILQLTIVGIILVPFLYFYQNMVQLDLGAQFARMTYKIENNENTDN